MKRELIFAAVALGLAAVLVTLLVAFFGAELNASTVALSVAAAALMYALRAMFGVVTALARPDLAATLHDQQVSFGTAEERRAEQRRVLKAIKELDFDHAMGKLSDDDHAALQRVYRLRAVELMRATDGAVDLHPELARELGHPVPAPSAGVGAEDGDGPVTAHDEATEAENAEAKSEAGARPQGIDVPEPVEAEGESDVATCEHCGGANEADAKSCRHCGKEIAGDA